MTGLRHVNAQRAHHRRPLGASEPAKKGSLDPPCLATRRLITLSGNILSIPKAGVTPMAQAGFHNTPRKRSKSQMYWKASPGMKDHRGLGVGEGIKGEAWKGQESQVASEVRCRQPPHPLTHISPNSPLIPGRTSTPRRLCPFPPSQQKGVSPLNCQCHRLLYWRPMLFSSALQGMD